MQMKPWVRSSTDPNVISNTLRGVVLSFSAAILAIAPLFNIPLTESDIASFASNVGLAGGALWTLYGLGMKALMWIGRQ